jgi:S-DNA-T family DNA segregation ATPase FtsK/SpoIIIE
VKVLVPAPPTEPERQPVPLLAVLAPLLLGIAMWRITGSTTFLLLTLLSPLMVLGNVVSDRRTGRRRSRRERRLWQARRDVAERTLESGVRADETARRAAEPDPAQVLLTALGPLPRLWERRRDDDDLLALRLGLADQPARVEVEGDPTGVSTTARVVPVVVPLREAGVLGVAALPGGSRAAAQALARSLVCGAAVWHSPRDLSLVVLAEPAAAAAWDWVGWLPHTRPDGGQDCRALLGLGAEQAAARVAELTALVTARRRAAPQGRAGRPHGRASGPGGARRRAGAARPSRTGRPAQRGARLWGLRRLPRGRPRLLARGVRCHRAARPSGALTPAGRGRPRADRVRWRTCPARPGPRRWPAPGAAARRQPDRSGAAGCRRACAGPRW